jgi:hypothetical protein
LVEHACHGLVGKRRGGRSNDRALTSDVQNADALNTFAIEAGRPIIFPAFCSNLPKSIDLAVNGRIRFLVDSRRVNYDVP